MLLQQRQAALNQQANNFNFPEIYKSLPIHREALLFLTDEMSQTKIYYR